MATGQFLPPGLGTPQAIVGFSPSPPASRVVFLFPLLALRLAQTQPLPADIGNNPASPGPQESFLSPLLALRLTQT